MPLFKAPLLYIAKTIQILSPGEKTTSKSAKNYMCSFFVVFLYLLHLLASVLAINTLEILLKVPMMIPHHNLQLNHI